MKKSDLYLAGTALLAAGALFVGCAKEPEPAMEEEDVTMTAETDEIFTPPVMAAAPVTAPETVIAVVNGEEIKQENINAEIAKMFPNAGQIPPEQLAQMQAQMNERVLETLIVKKLLLDEANKENIEVNPDQINETIEKIRESLPPGTSLDEQLAKANMTEESFRTVLAEDLRISNLMKAKLDIEQEPSDEDLQAFYNDNPQMFDRPESVKASHILVTFDAEDDDATKAEKKSKLEAIREKILGGGDFAAEAKEGSDCPSAKQGGDLGTFQRGQMVPAFEDAAFTQEIGTVGEVVETQFGYHIIMVTDRMDAGKVPFDEAKEAIAKQIQNQKGRSAVGDYIETLKETADIQFPQALAQ